MIIPVCEACDWRGDSTMDMAQAQRDAREHRADHETLFSLSTQPSDPSSNGQMS